MTQRAWQLSGLAKDGLNAFQVSVFLSHHDGWPFGQLLFDETLEIFHNRQRRHSAIGMLTPDRA